MPDYPESEYCTFLFDDGRRCRGLKMPTRHVCILHWKQDGQFNEDELAMVELARRSRSLDTPLKVNRALGTLFRLIVEGKVPPRKGSQLAYVGHLLLCSMPKPKRMPVAASSVGEAEQAPATDEPLVAVPALPDDAIDSFKGPQGGLAPVAGGTNGNSSNGST